jgi:hypothetical protein
MQFRHRHVTFWRYRFKPTRSAYWSLASGRRK